MSSLLSSKKTWWVCYICHKFSVYVAWGHWLATWHLGVKRSLLFMLKMLIALLDTIFPDYPLWQIMNEELLSCTMTLFIIWLVGSQSDLFKLSMVSNFIILVDGKGEFSFQSFFFLSRIFIFYYPQPDSSVIISIKIKFYQKRGIRISHSLVDNVFACK